MSATTATAHFGGVGIGLVLQVEDERVGGRLRGRHAELVLQRQLLLERRIVCPQLLDCRPVPTTKLIGSHSLNLVTQHQSNVTITPMRPLQHTA